MKNKTNIIDITNIKINLVNNSKVLAFATVTINDSIVISNIRLYEGSKGKFIVFPSRKSKQGRNFDIVFPCQDDVRKLILEKIEMQYLNEVIK